VYVPYEDVRQFKPYKVEVEARTNHHTKTVHKVFVRRLFKLYEAEVRNSNFKLNRSISKQRYDVRNLYFKLIPSISKQRYNVPNLNLKMIQLISKQRYDVRNLNFKLIWSSGKQRYKFTTKKRNRMAPSAASLRDVIDDLPAEEAENQVDEKLDKRRYIQVDKTDESRRYK